MNFLEQDLPWLTAEARSDPDTAQRIVKALAERAQALQQQADELRAENVLLKRSGSQQDQVQRLKTDLRDLRSYAERNGLNRDVVSILAFTGHGLHIPAPAPFEQTLTLTTAPDEPVRDLKPLYLASATRLDSLLVAISGSSGFRLALVNGLGWPLSEGIDWRDARLGMLSLQRGERIEAACALNELRPPRMIALATRRGWVRAMSWSLVENLTISGQTLTLLDKSDTPVWIGGCDESATNIDLLLLTRNGRWTRFPLSSVDAGGSSGIALEADDDVAWAAAIREGDAGVYFVGADGAQLAVASSGLEAHKKPGAKSQSLTKRFIALACFAARKSDAVLLLSNSGDLVVETLRALPVAARPSEAQPLNVVNQRLIAATTL
jgi:hypothetical protein